MDAPLPRLTSLAHGGGCGCKLAPSVLRDLLAGERAANVFPQLLVGNETADDAAVWELDQNNCIISTTDFFMPMVDDPFDFGRIAATNAISDVYAMGGRPLMALAILGMPIDKLPAHMIRRILEGGEAVCRAAGIPIAGGHSIDAPEPIYGLAVTGVVSKQHLRRNSDARPGDALILTKPLGVGIYSAAFKRGVLSDAAYDEMIETTTKLNSVGTVLAQDPDVHALTDVTGFGILGHGLEVARGASLRVILHRARLPLLSEADSLAQSGCFTGASVRNWSSYGAEVHLPGDIADWQRHLLTDPQTSGGLLLSCPGARAEDIVQRIVAAGYPQATVIGEVEAGAPGIEVI